MDNITLSLLLGCAVLLILYLWNRYNYWNKHGIPSAKGVLPLFGNILPVLTFRDSLSDYCRKIYNDNKDCSMLGFYNLTNPILIVREPELVKTVMQSQFPHFHNNVVSVDREIDPLIARNPFLADGEEWITGRKRLTYAFSSMRLKILFESVLGVCKKFDDYLEKRFQSSDKYEVELKDLFSKFTGEVVANAGLGIEGHCFDEKPHASSFHQIGKAFLEPSFKNMLSMGMMFVFPQISKLLRIPFVPKEVDLFFRTVTKEVMECRRKETVPRNDFLQLMVDLEKTEGEKLDEEAITSHAFSFFLDGYETSSITLCFAGIALALHQDVQDKLRDEVKRVSAKYDGAITYDSLKEMKYMDQVISESQRIYPALGMLQKLCTKEYELIGSDGIKFRATPGTQIYISTHGLHMDPDLWPDPETFDPERFNEDRKKDMTKFTFLPFGDGPRACVGMRMAIVQMKACLASLLLKHKIELSPKLRLPIKLLPFSVMSYPTGGAWVSLKRL